MENLKIENASKKYGNQIVLKDVNIVCKVGSITGIVGYNGCGKSVLFKCICGFEKLDSGGILVNGRPKKNSELLKDTGIIIEEPAFLKQKSGYDNLKYLYMIRNKIDKKHLYLMMELVGLNPEEKKPVGKYSLGMKQRLAIAQAIMENPQIIILDEPMNGLDKKGVEEMRALFLKLKKEGKIILLASHNKEDISLLCDCCYEFE